MNPDNNQKNNQPEDKTDQSGLYSWREDTSTPVDSVQDQRQGAANVARHQAEHIYQHNPPNQPVAEPEHTQPQTNTNPYLQTHQPTYDWQRYHTAWQSYYQQYYQRYFQAQLLAEQQKEPPTLQDTQHHADGTITGSDNTFVPRSRFQQVRDDLLGKVAERTRTFQKSNRFVPIMCGLVVVLLLLFVQFNRFLVAYVEGFISPGSTAANAIIVDPAANANVSADPRLIIPKINVNAPVVYSVTTVDERAIQAALQHGVVRYNLPGASSVPGQQGNTVILGHSSNDVFDPGSYKFAFVLIDRLQQGDVFYMNYQGKRYAYAVTRKAVIKPADWHTLQQNDGKPTVILVTGTPVGSATDRLLVYGQQISPDPGTASPAPANNQDANPDHIPGNSETFFERILGLFP